MYRNRIETAPTAKNTVTEASTLLQLEGKTLVKPTKGK